MAGTLQATDKSSTRTHIIPRQHLRKLTSDGSYITLEGMNLKRDRIIVDLGLELGETVAGVVGSVIQLNRISKMKREGVKPQTKEAIEHINNAKIPFIVVFTKTDLPAASVDVALAELEKEGIFFEGRGGQTPYIGVSAKKKEGLKELLDLINLLSDVKRLIP